MIRSIVPQYMAMSCGGPLFREKRAFCASLDAALYAWFSSMYLMQTRWSVFALPLLMFGRYCLHCALQPVLAKLSKNVCREVLRTWKHVAFISNPSSISYGAVKIWAPSQYIVGNMSNEFETDSGHHTPPRHQIDFSFPAIAFLSLDKSV